MKTDGLLYTSRTGDILRDRLGRAKTSVTIIAPFITKGAFDFVTSNLGRTIECTVITTWEPYDIAVGVSDPAITDTLKRFDSARLLLCERLHAKLYFTDDSSVLFGSANITGKALEIGHRGNIETLFELSPVPMSFILMKALIESRSHVASETIKNDVLDAAARIEVPSLNQVHSIKPEYVTRKIPIDGFPTFRTPERLYSAYKADPYEKEETTANLIADLTLLGIPPGLDSLEFHQAIKDGLKALPLIEALDRYLVSPRRFGEIRQWLQSTAEIAEKTRAEHLLQTIIRWLTYFANDQYFLDTSRHTEVFGRRA